MNVIFQGESHDLSEVDSSDKDEQYAQNRSPIGLAGVQ
jgi:hypothetical protein